MRAACTYRKSTAQHALTCLCVAAARNLAETAKIGPDSDAALTPELKFEHIDALHTPKHDGMRQACSCAKLEHGLVHAMKHPSQGAEDLLGSKAHTSLWLKLERPMHRTSPSSTSFSMARL